MTPFVEAALRSILLAAAVAAGLGLFRVRNVITQKLAWSLVLASAFAMPLLLPVAAHWGVGPAFSLPAHPATTLRALLPARPAAATIPPPHPPVVASPAAPRDPGTPESPCPIHCAVSSSHSSENTAASQISAAPVAPASLNAVPLIARVDTPPPALAHAAPALALPRIPSERVVLLVYFAVTALLVMRLAAGLFAALALLFSSTPIPSDEIPVYARGLRLRSNAALAAPVTVGSVILLPADFAAWEPRKLSIVLAHERSHLRQGDFYLQLAASLYAALVWFSPLGWWLRRRLSDLGETISDRAALAQAASRPDYARLLLEFAAVPRPTPIGVAMARPHRLTRRIENLLHESRFTQAFAGGRRSLVAVALVPLALVFATAAVRVQAASQQTPPAPPVPASSAAAPEPAPAALAADVAEPATPPEPPAPPAAGSNDRLIVQDGDTVHMNTSNGESYAFITGNGNKMVGTAMLHGSTNPSIDKARRLAHGDFLWFTRNGKSYYIDDPAVVAQVRGTYEEMETLGEKQAEFGRQQEQFARQQEKFAREMADFHIDESQLKVTVPDLSKQKAELDAALAQLQPLVGKTVDQSQLAHLQEQLGAMQARLSTLDAQFAQRMAEFAAKQQSKNADWQRKMADKQREWSAIQGKLGAEQGRLGGQQDKLAREAEQKAHGLIEKSLQNGSAHPVD